METKVAKIMDTMENEEVFEVCGDAYITNEKGEVVATVRKLC